MNTRCAHRQKEYGATSISPVVEDRVFAEVKRLCCSTFDEATLLRGLAESLKQVVPFDAYCLHMMDPSTGLITHAFAENVGSKEQALFYFEHLYFEDEIEKFHWANWDKRPVKLLSDATGGRLSLSRRYRELFGGLGLGHAVLGSFSVGREAWGGADLNREKGRADFKAREVAFLRRVAPHLGAGLKAAVLRSQALSEPKRDSAPGVLVLDARGRVLHYTAAAERWLRELGDLHPGWREGGNLPVAVWTVASALRRAMNPQAERDRNIVPRLCVATRSGRWLTLQAARSEPDSDRAEETVIVVEPTGPKEMAWLRAEAYGFSAREREVVDLVVRGASNKQISQALYISEYTVQDHLSNIFDKVGARGRHALVKQFFLDNLLPSLFE